MKTGPKPYTFEEAKAIFYSKLQPAENGCILWTGAKGQHGGYGVLNFMKEKWRAHRLVYFLRTGTKPDLIMHTCDNPLCCNFDHLRAGTQAQNLRDAVARGRMAIGELNGQAKLTNTQALEIKERRAAGERTEDLARAFGVHPVTIRNCASGRTFGRVA